jgi:hypothetical protein
LLIGVWGITSRQLPAMGFYFTELFRNSIRQG